MYPWPPMFHPCTFCCSFGSRTCAMFIPNYKGSSVMYVSAVQILNLHVLYFLLDLSELHLTLSSTLPLSLNPLPRLPVLAFALPNPCPIQNIWTAIGGRHSVQAEANIQY